MPASAPLPPLINEALAREQFAALGAVLALTLAQAAAEDLAQWSHALLAATLSADAAAAARARHALTGLCGNFGAEALLALAAGPLLGEDERAALLACHATTAAALAEVARRLAP